MTYSDGNFFAVSARDPGLLKEIRADMQHSGVFDRVWTTDGSWVVGVSHFAKPTSLSTASHLVFAEGARDGAAWSDEALVTDRASVNPSAVAQMPGDATLAIFGTNHALLVRARGGQAPLLYGQQAQVAAVSSLSSYLARFLPEEPEPDPVTHAAWLSMHPMFPRGRSFFRGFSVLPRGAYVLLEHDPVKQQRATPTYYFQPPDAPCNVSTPAQRAEHIAEFRSALLSALDAQLSDTTRHLLMLSGGVDSTSLAALCSLRLRKPLDAISFLAEPTAPSHVQERAFIDPLLAECEIPGDYAETSHAYLYDGTEPLPALPAYQYNPAAWYLNQHPGRWRGGSLVTGMFADELCGGPRLAPDWARRTSARQLVTLALRGEVFPRDALRWGKYRLPKHNERPPFPFQRPAPAFLAQSLREEHEATTSELAEIHRKDTSSLPTTWLYWRVMESPAADWEVCGHHGMRACTPFLSRATLELAARLHPSELNGGGTKKLLRRALSGDVPSRTLLRKDKGTPGASVFLENTPVHSRPVQRPGGAYAALFDARWLAEVGERELLSVLDLFALRQVLLFERHVSLARKARSSSIKSLG